MEQAISVTTVSTLAPEGVLSAVQGLIRNAWFVLKSSEFAYWFLTPTFTHFYIYYSELLYCVCWSPTIRYKIVLTNSTLDIPMWLRTIIQLKRKTHYCKGSLPLMLTSELGLTCRPEQDKFSKSCPHWLNNVEWGPSPSIWHKHHKHHKHHKTVYVVNCSRYEIQIIQLTITCIPN